MKVNQIICGILIQSNNGRWIIAWADEEKIQWKHSGSICADNFRSTFLPHFKGQNTVTTFNSNSTHICIKSTRAEKDRFSKDANSCGDFQVYKGLWNSFSIGKLCVVRVIAWNIDKCKTNSHKQTLTATWRQRVIRHSRQYTKVIFVSFI